MIGIIYNSVSTVLKDKKQNNNNTGIIKLNSLFFFVCEKNVMLMLCSPCGCLPSDAITI